MQRFFLLLPFVLLATQAAADIRLPAIFGSHMVLQQQSQLTFWGWAAPKDEVRVLCDWLPGQQFEARADRNTLKWSVQIPVPAAELLPHTITIKGGWTDQVLDDIYFGEVWLCSGQSNMEWQPSWGNVDITEEQYNAANDPGLRLFTVPRSSLPAPQDDCRGQWQVSTRETMTHFSAAAYFFGRELRNRLGVPVGLLNTSWGGTPVESWIPEASLRGIPGVQIDRDDHPIWNYGRAGSLYNGMIAPLTSLRVKGFLWYQGETNTYNPYAYAGLLAQMVADWRTVFGEADAPFYYVQIAPFQYETPKVGVLVREQQRLALQQIPNSGMVVVSDIGNIADIHPHNKVDVGKRLAAWALTHTYGQNGLPVSGPLYRSHQVANGQIRVEFDYASQGLRAVGGPLTGFEIAGADRVFYPAKAVIDDTSVIASAPQVPEPAALRFAFENTAEPNLFNAEGLPASCFRTDNWRVFFPGVQYAVTGFDPDGRVRIALHCPDPAFSIHYTTDGTTPDINSPLATNDTPLLLAPGQPLLIRIFDTDGAPGPRTDTIFLKPHRALGKAVTASASASPRKPGSSVDRSLTDGVLATPEARDDAWQGYEGTDAAWTIDLGKVQPVQRISAGFLSATANRVFLPVQLRFAVSADGKNFTEISVQEEPVPEKDTPPARKVYSAAVQQKARYVRVSAQNVGRIPQWSSSKGGPAWLFVDEIAVE